MPDFNAKTATPVAASAPVVGDSAILGNQTSGWYTILLENLLTSILRVSTGTVSKTADNNPLVVKMASGQTNDAWQVQNNGSNVLAKVTNAGAIVSQNAAGTASLTVSSTGLAQVDASGNQAGWDITGFYVIPIVGSPLSVNTISGITSFRSSLTAASSGSVPFVVKGATSQTANLIQLQSSTGGVLSYFGSDGALMQSGTMIVRQSGGTAGTDEVQISHDGTNVTIKNMDSGAANATIILQNTTNGVSRVLIKEASTNRFFFNNANLDIGSGGGVRISSGDPTAVGPDIGIARSAAGVMKITNGSTGLGSLDVGTNSTSRVPLAITGIASQTADMLTVTSSGSALLASISSTGKLSLQTPNTTIISGLTGGDVLRVIPHASAGGGFGDFVLKPYASTFAGGPCLSVGLGHVEQSGRIYDLWEHDYRPDTSGDNLQERHFLGHCSTTAGGRTAGDQVRFMSITWKSNSNYCNIYQTCSDFVWKDISYPTLTSTNPPECIYAKLSNAGIFNLACTDGSITRQGLDIACNSAGEVTLAPNGGATRIRVTNLWATGDLRVQDSYKLITNRVQLVNSGSNNDRGFMSGDDATWRFAATDVSGTVLGGIVSNGSLFTTSQIIGQQSATTTVPFYLRGSSLGGSSDTDNGFGFRLVANTSGNRSMQMMMTDAISSTPSLYFAMDTTNAYISAVNTAVNATVPLQINSSNFVVTTDGRTVVRKSNTDPDMAAGANTHILMDNSSATGQTGLMMLINGTMRSKWRTDYVGNVNWVANGGSHVFWVGGDYDTGSAPLIVNSNGALQIGNTTAPSGTPSASGYLYVEGGALKYKGSSGTVTTLANA